MGGVEVGDAGVAVAGGSADMGDVEGLPGLVIDNRSLNIWELYQSRLIRVYDEFIKQCPRMEKRDGETRNVENSL